MQSLKGILADWKDWDFALFYLARHLGAISEKADKPWVGTGAPYKYMFWTSHPLGEMCHRILTEMIDYKMILDNGEGQCKWNPDYAPEGERKEG